MVNIEIDGQNIEVESGSMIIEAADAANIYIPRFCYHRKLSIAANCRMCLVEVEKAPKPMPACATPVSEGMKVFTQTQKALQAQKAVMEFLLINHPLDCPICDQGGECELQDLSMGFGRDNSLYTDVKRAVDDEDLGPLIDTNMTRCIHCTRCVRFGHEIAGFRELGAINRGEDMMITTFIKQTLKSELSANIIDLCPVGALTSKPYRYQARPWELKQHPMIAPHDCVGSNIYVHTRRGEVMRVVPRDNEAINENWLSDRDRFSYSAVNHDDRLLAPMIKKDGHWQTVDWKTAFDVITTKLPAILAEFGANQLGAIISPSATVEEMFLLQKLCRSLGTQNIDHRLHQTDFSDDNELPSSLGLDGQFSDILASDQILLIGANVQREQPILAHWLRQASLQDSQIHALNTAKYKYYFQVANHIANQPSQLADTLAAVAKKIANDKQILLPANLKAKIGDAHASQETDAIADALTNAKQGLIILGAVANNLPNAALLRALANFISICTKAKIAYFTEGANSRGAFLTGVLPHRQAYYVKNVKAGLHTQAMLQAKLKAYFLFGIEPTDDLANPGRAVEALQQADFVVSFTAFTSEQLMQHANVLLPIVPFTETSGTYINLTNQAQSFAATAIPAQGSRPGWKVLRVLANLLGQAGFDYVDSNEILAEINANAETATTFGYLTTNNVHSDMKQHDGLQSMVEWPIYRIDSLCRRSIALQEAYANDPLAIYMNAKTAELNHVSQSNKVRVSATNWSADLPLIIDETMPMNCALLPATYAATNGMPETFTKLTIEASHD